MADVTVRSWEDPAMTDYPLFIDKDAGDVTNVNGLTEVGPDILYNAYDFRDLLYCMVSSPGRVKDSDFVITPTGINTISISGGFAFIQSASAVEGTYFVHNRGTVTLTLPAYGSGVEQYRIAIVIADRADNPSALYPNNYGWYFIVLDNVGVNAAALPAGALNIGVVTKTGASSTPTVNPFDNTINPRTLASFGRNDKWSGRWSRDPGLAATATQPAGFTFYNTWTEYGFSFSTPRYRRNNDGKVTLEGLLAAGASSNSDSVFGGGAEAMVRLPVGFRPKQNLIVPCLMRYLGKEQAGRLTIKAYNDTTYGGFIAPFGGEEGYISSGNYKRFNYPPNTGDWVSLDGISFQAYENQYGEIY